MEQSQALHKLLESADLIKMIEDLANTGAYEKLSAAGLAGIKITLATVRERILASHDAIAYAQLQELEVREARQEQELVVPAESSSVSSGTSILTTTPPLATMLSAQNNSAQGNGSGISVENGAKAEAPPLRSETSVTNSRMALLSDPEKLQMMRRDLRASLEKMVESR